MRRSVGVKNKKRKPRKARTFNEYLMKSLRDPGGALAYLEASLEFGNKSILSAVGKIAEAHNWERALKSWHK